MQASWLVATATLPTSSSGLRVRVRRALKATGAGTLREGVYVLPEHAASAQRLWDLERTIVEAGAEAHMPVVRSRDTAQEEEAFRALFARAGLYAEFLHSVNFFSGKHSRRAADALAALRRAVELHL